MHDNTLAEIFPLAVTTDNYKLIRALWFALYTPDAGRHDALLADDIPDVYRRLFDHILAGTLPAEDDPEGLQLLTAVTDLKTPRKIARTMPQLGDEFFSHAAGGDDEGIDLTGGGEWPKAPQHTCAAKEAVGTALIIRPNETAATRMFNPTWRTCPACYHKRVKRAAMQTRIEIAAAGAMNWTILDPADYRKWTANMRQHKRRTGTEARYRAFPQADGKMFVMATHGIAGSPVPTDNGALYDLLHQYANTPDGKRASSSWGYGGDYKRMKGDGRSNGVRLWTDAPLEKVAGALGTEVKRGRNTIRVEIDQFEAFQRMSDAGIAMRARKGQGTAVQSLMDVTLKGYEPEEEPEEPLSLMRDSEEGEEARAHELQPPLSDFEAEEVPIWPIYLP